LQVNTHTSVIENEDCIALQLGPLVYCIKTVDNPLPLHLIRLPEDARLTSHFEPELLEGITVIEGDASALKATDWAGTLYRTAPPEHEAQHITAIPYYAWDNRQAGEMRVWIRTGA